MKTTICACLTFAALVLAGCGGPAEAPTAEPATPAEAMPVAETPAEPTDGATAVPASEGGLPGTTWSYTGLTLTFFEDGKLHVKGGVLGDAGLEGTYTLSGTVVQVSVGGQELSGNFDGTALTIGDGPAERLN